MSNRILRRPDVEARTGLPRSTIYDWMKDGRFPRAIKLGGRAVGWPSEAIDQWIEERTAASQQAA